jgi:tetratricopeptide (TPR) repeat protein
VARKLDDISLESLTHVEEKWRPAAAGPKFARFFAETLKADLTRDDPARVAALVRASGARHALVAALDYWAELSQEEGSGYADLLWRLLEAARLADPDPWRDRFRQPAVWRDRKQLERLAAEPGVPRQPPHTLMALAAHLDRLGGDGAAVLRAALVHHPNDFWLNLTASHLMKDPGKRSGYVQAALAVRPRNSVACNNLATSLGRQGRVEEAAEAYRRAIAIDPTHPTPVAGLGQCLARQGKAEEAVALYQKAIALNPKYAYPHGAWGQVLMGQQKFAEAAEKFRTGADLDPRSPYYPGEVGFALYRSGDAAAAEKEYRRAIALGANNHTVYNRLGLALARQKKDVEAARAYQRAADLDPTSAVLQRNLGEALIRLGKLAEAAEAMRKAAALGPENGQAASLFPVLLLRLGRFAEAREVARQALDRMPEGDSRRGKLQEVWEECGRCLAVQQGDLRPAKAEDLAEGVEGKLSSADLIDSHELGRRGFRKAHAVRLEAGKSYQVDLDASFDPVLRIEDAAGTHLLENDDASPPGGRAARLVFTPAADGVFKLVVNSFKAKEVGTYTLKFREVAPAGALKAIKGELTTADRGVREHRVKLDAGTPYVIELASGEFGTRLSLLDPEGKALRTTNGSPAFLAWGRYRIDFTPPESGEYILQVGSTHSGETGSYTLNVQPFGPPESGPE